jgi:hypothetical protein
MGTSARLLLPRALLVAVRLQALAALMLVHLQPAFLFQVAHEREQSWPDGLNCKADKKGARIRAQGRNISNGLRLAAKLGLPVRPHRCCSFAHARALIGLLLLPLPGCVQPSDLALPLHPFVATDQDVPIIEKGDAAPRPTLLTQDTAPLAEFARLSAGTLWKASATVDFIVDEHGIPRQVFFSTATDPLYGEAAAISVSRWRYTPGLKKGKPMRVHMQVSLTGSSATASAPAGR